MNATPGNYTFFTTPTIDKSAEALQNNKGFEDHPELGVLYAETPCDNCYELIGRRTEISKTFIKEGTGGKSIMQQTSNAAMHYRDMNGNWRTIHTQLAPAGNGVYAATEQPAPISINTTLKYSTIGKAGESFRFNNNLELIYVKPDGSIQSLGSADWSHYTAGDDGVYVTNAWPGIDIEMHTVRGAVKTSFVINSALPDYADGELLVRDHLEMEPGWSLYAPMAVGGKAKYTGNLEVRNNAGDKIYALSAANAYEKGNIKGSLQMLQYNISGNELDIDLPGNFLNRPASAYPVIIDPLVSIATTSVVNGSTYSPAWSVGCVYANAATVPPNVTVTDVQFNFQYITSGGALLDNGAFDFHVSTCRSPTPTGLYWNCNSTLTGTCTGIAASILPSISSCMPAPTCSSYNLNVTMNFYQDYLSDPPCSNLYITASSPLTITVFGNTVETSAITAVPSTICQGQSTSLTATSTYGVTPYTFVWSPGGLTGATVTESPTTNTTYTVTCTDACGDISTATTSVTVNPSSPITGITTICMGGTTTLNDASGGGTWTSSNTAVASISSSGIATAVSPGTAVITYSTVTGCTPTVTVTVDPPVGIVTGITRDCARSSITLSDGTSGGTWSSGNSAVATVNTITGVVIGVSAGSAVITYTTYGGGCFATTTMSIDPLASITGPSTVCLGGTASLSDAISGGEWVSTSPSVASIGSASGIVTGGSIGTTTIIYNTIAGCSTTTSISVIALAPISGIETLCQGDITILTDAASGGIWSSSNTAVTSIGSTTGVLSGISGGTATISYGTPGGCAATTVVTVNAAAPITGVPSMCTGGTTILGDTPPGGLWSSSNSSIATVGAVSGIVRGLANGTAVITYTSTAGCTATITVTVSAPTPITGTAAICQGGTSPLADAGTGGTWSSSNSGIASINSGSGIVTGLSPGTATITYTTAGGCAVTDILTINPLSSITGTTTVCVSSTVTLGSTVAGGTWSSSNTLVATIGSSTGMLTGASVGAATISYITPFGCVTTTTATVNVPTAIIGASIVCEGSTTTLSNITTGGTWSSSATTIATVGLTTGVTTGVSSGSATIMYNTPGGCSSTVTISVNPVAPITGITSMCQGSTITLSNAVSGGTWSSLNTFVATVDASSGVVTGLSAGTSTIRYSTSGGCVSNINVIVNAMPAMITGPVLVCGTASYANAVTGGVWSSSNATIGTVNSGTGVVTALSSGATTITYTMPGGCYTTTGITVSLIDPIGGIPVVCQGNTTTLTYSSSGGIWSSPTTTVATVDAALGIVTGVSSGTATIRYTTLSGCIAAIEVTVNPLSPITGAATVCQGSTISLLDAAVGGTWSSLTSSVATVGIISGGVTGVSAGTSMITYTTSAGCVATIYITVNPTAPVTGIISLCSGNTTTLSDAVAGGTWSSLNTAVATVDETGGTVTGVAAGTSVINYATIEDCITSATITVHPLPLEIEGSTAAMCAGGTTTLTDGLGGGIWVSGNTAVATVNSSSGVVSAISAGTVNITYTTTVGCFATTTITVNPLPLSITGVASICVDGTTALNDLTTGGMWSSLSTTIASIDAGTGFVSGLSAGTAVIEYTTPAGCLMAINITVNPLPSAITGVTTVCAGATATLFDALTGGTWSSDNTAVADIGSASGTMTGMSAGTATISYFTPFGCFATVGAIVNPTPSISGTATSYPTHCNTTDGTITLNGLTAGESYSVTYDVGGTPVTLSLTANGAGQVVIASLAAGSYTNISVTTSLGCASNIVLGPIVLSLPASPPAPSAGNNTPICAGLSLDLTATDITPGVTYSWTGPGGFTSGLQDPIINPSTVSLSGTYSVTAASLGCVSAPATTIVIIHPIPDITNVSYTDPTTCQGTDGTITITGLLAGVSYTVAYTFNTTHATLTVIADGSGNVVIPGVSSGTYSGISVTSFTCRSNTAGPVTLIDPSPPLPPSLGNNGPVCSGNTLLLTASDPITGLTYEWAGPNGFSSDSQNPEIPNVVMADSGLYTLTIKHVNCPASASENVIIRPPVVLTDVTPSQTIPFGSSKQLTASGAEYYLWFPNDGSLSNIDIRNPVATPPDSTTYTLEGINQWGCMDTAMVSLNVDYHIDEYIPNAFTPNNDGRNDIFRIVNAKYDKLIDFSIYNRWGQMIYDNSSDINQGWDGTFNGVPQDMGTYYYNIIVSSPDGNNKNFKGSVTLIR